MFNYNKNRSIEIMLNYIVIQSDDTATLRIYIVSSRDKIEINELSSDTSKFTTPSHIRKK